VYIGVDEMSEEATAVRTEGEEEELRRLALHEYQAVLTRTMEIVVRFLQYRMRELLVQGLKFNYSVDTRYTEKGMEVVIRVEIPNEMIEQYMEKARFLKKRISTARHVDRFFYKTDIVTEETEKKEGEKNE